jgi:uroporphyrinogen III methyltransferase/synthase
MRTLQGLRIVVTRAAYRGEELAASLRTLGAEVILLPVIDIAPPLDPEPLRHAAVHSNHYDWIIFTSANGVAAFATQLPKRQICKARIATVGAATRQTAEARGFRVDITPIEYVAEALIEAFAGEDLNHRRVLIPSAAVTRDIVPRELRKRGAEVDVVEAYRNVVPQEAAEKAAGIFQEPYPDWVLFASSSAVDNLVQLITVDRLRHTRIATIGPITSKTVRKHGLSVAAEAEIHTAQGLIDALRLAFA